MRKKVPFEGPSNYKIMCVGEAPGEWEERLGRPFVSLEVAKQNGFTIERGSTAGELLERYLGRCQVNRSDVMLANLFQYRPPGNRFEAILDDPELPNCIEELRQEIIRGKANGLNVIIALGGWPLYYLTGHSSKEKGKIKPGSGILTFRGSRYNCRLPGCEQVKVFATMHPAFVLRAWKYNPLFHVDIQHAVEDSTFPELKLPEYEEFIDPIEPALIRHVEAANRSGLVSLDIETFPGGRASCIGFAYRSSIGRFNGVCVTFKAQNLWGIVRELWSSPTPKVLQYGTYDISFMKHFYGWDIGGFYDGLGWDTYVASASILPDSPRSLDFLTSIYTRMPYYKAERKIWKEKKDLTVLWRYNIKDTICTHIIADAQKSEIKELFG